MRRPIRITLLISHSTFLYIKRKIADNANKIEAVKNKPLDTLSLAILKQENSITAHAAYIITVFNRNSLLKWC